MDSNCLKISSIISAFVFSLLLISLINSAQSINVKNTNSSFDQSRIVSKRPEEIKDNLKNMNKYSVKTIQSPDGDVIDCVPSHLQPAFDHPYLKGQKPMEPPPEMVTSNETWEEIQVWRMSGESCPDSTIPIIRRTTEEEGEEASFSDERRRIELAGVETVFGQYYGGSAYMQSWQPSVKDGKDSSASQIQIISGVGPHGVRTIIAAGLQVYPAMYNSYTPKIFISTSTDSGLHVYYNLDGKTGFVQTSNKIAIGGNLIGKVSQVGGEIHEMAFVVQRLFNQNKDNKMEWWLIINGEMVGYWKVDKIPLLGTGSGGAGAFAVRMGGEVGLKIAETHSTTGMGSGHFAKEGFNVAAAFRDINVYNKFGGKIIKDNMWKAISPRDGKCFSATGLFYRRFDRQLNNCFLYGGPGGDCY